MTVDGVIFESASSLARRLRAQEVGARELAEACLRRIEAVNPKLNAVVQLRAEGALDEADAADRALARGDAVGPLHGVPVTIKDSFDTAGVVSTWGTPGRASFVPERDATAVARLRAAGAILLGKTNTPELTLSFHTKNRVYGETHNPYALDRTPGGSSGGAAAILAAGGAALDLGTDTGGSIRLPAHYCGVAGLRPTSGRVSRAGHAVGPEGPIEALTTVGPLARRVEDLALALPIICGPDPADPAIAPAPLRDAAEVDLGALRVAFHVDNGLHTPTTEVAEAVRSTVKLLAGAGARVEESVPPGIEETMTLFGSLLGYWAPWTRRILERAGTPLDQVTIANAREPAAFPPERQVELFERWHRFRVRMLEWLDDYDLLVCPPNAAPAPPPAEFPPAGTAFSYTMTYNLTGWPGAVVRAGTDPDGLPVGVQLVARPWREDVALAAAARVESALGGFAPPPL